eukprot:481783-Lingulodinium_polyedra.AAC.1
MGQKSRRRLRDPAVDAKGVQLQRQREGECDVGGAELGRDFHGRRAEHADGQHGCFHDADCVH